MESKRRNVSVLIPYQIENGEVKVFLQKRTLDAPHNPDFFGFFGGGVEEGENAEEALQREIKEELSIKITDYRFWRTHEFEHGTLHIFLLPVNADFEDQIQVLEGQYGKFLSREEILQEKVIDWDRDVLLDFIDNQAKVI